MITWDNIEEIYIRETYIKGIRHPYLMIVPKNVEKVFPPQGTVKRTLINATNFGKTPQIGIMEMLLPMRVEKLMMLLHEKYGVKIRTGDGRKK